LQYYAHETSLTLPFFLLKYLYQARKMSRHIYVLGGIDFT
jgi:hypothetical protein